MPRFTKDAIKRSFKNLLKEKNYREITVKEIAADCKLNRNSFYYHYQDLPSLLEEVVRETCLKITGEAEGAGSLGEYFESVFEKVYVSRREIMHVCRSLENDEFERGAWKCCAALTEAYFYKKRAADKWSEKDRLAAEHFARCALFGLFKEWMDSSFSEETKPELKRLKELKGFFSI